MKFTPIGTFNPKLDEVDVIGAGISGLAISYFLSQKGYKINLFEKSHRVGGKIVTDQTQNGLVEKAANTLLLNSELKQVLEQLDLKFIEARPKLKKQVMLGTTQFNLRQKLFLMFKIICSCRKKIPTQENSVQEFFEPLMGNFFSTELLSAVLGGIYGIESKYLSPKNLFPLDHPYFTKPRSYWQLFRFLKSQKPKNDLKKMITFAGGMEDLPRKFFEKTKFQSVHLQTDYEITNQLKRNIIVCTDAIQAGELLKNLTPAWSKELEQTQYQSLSTTTFFLNKNIKQLDQSFGMLFSPQSRYYSLGVLSRSEIFQEKENSYNFIASGLISNELVEKDLHQFIRNPSILEKTSAIWSHAIPVMNENQYNRLEKLRLTPPTAAGNVLLFSHYLGGVSLRDIVLSAKDFANQMD